ncbi:MAG: PQQ-dependent sugar dehydrogenase, partial [Solirubrobacterales bacterium]
MGCGAWSRGVLGALLALLALPSAAAAATLPKQFEETTVIDGLGYPTAVSFAPNGRVFIAEQSGVIKTYSRVRDSTPTVLADLRTEVHRFNDRGLLGMTIDPRFPEKPHLYALYARDAPLGGSTPTWGKPSTDSDGCPDPPGVTDGCVISGRLVRLTVGKSRVKRTKVLVDDWCQQAGTHSIGDLAFGASGALYASAGDGATPSYTDYGQEGQPPNPCGDPPAGVGGQQSPPSAEGGSLRSQDLRTPADPTTLSGSVIRIDPRDGSADKDNPLSSSHDPNARRIVAHGFRNPFRLAVRPDTDEVWVADVGSAFIEEIDRVQPGAVSNYGWPCFEGHFKHPGFDPLDFDLCESLYAEEAATGQAVAKAWFSYQQGYPTVEGDGCDPGQSAISAIAFYPRGAFPKSFDGALFFGDYTRQCIWVAKAEKGGLPDPELVRPFLVGDATPVDLESGPGGLFYVDILNGELRRIRFIGGNRSPRASLGASRRYGPLPLRVRFNASKSRDPEGKRLRFRWDLDGDGRFDDSRRKRPTRTYTRARPVTVSLRARDRHRRRDVERLRIFPGNT